MGTATATTDTPSTATAIHPAETHAGAGPRVPRLLSKADIAEFFDVSIPTINWWIRTGRLAAPIRIGRRPVFPADFLDRLMNKGA